VSSSYSDLAQYRACPRLFGFTKLGYRSAGVNEPLTTGSLVHAGLAAHFKGQDPMKTIDDYYSQLMDRYSEDNESSVALLKARNRSKPLLTRYITGWAGDYKATLIEAELELNGVVCHPDLIAFYKEQRVIVDYKTSYHPDDRWYDISNQTDLYAYIVGQLELKGHPDASRISLIIYDIISEEGIYRHMRPPRLEAGKRLYEAVQELNNLSGEGMGTFLAEPHPDYTCPSRCKFFGACFILETDTWESCRDFLEENFIKEEER